MSTRPQLVRTTLAGLAGGAGFVLGTFLTFSLLGGSRQDETGILFDPDTQQAKVIAVWKEIEPLPRVIEQPPLILGGMILLGVAFAFVYRSVACAWPTGIARRAVRLFGIIWIVGLFAEFIGPFNVLNQPFGLTVVGWSFWAVPAALTSIAITVVLERSNRPTGPALDEPATVGTEPV